MREKINDKIKRIIREKRIQRIKATIKKAVEEYNKLNNGAFLAFTWEYDRTTTFHITKEQFLPNCHVYGTRVDYYGDDTH